MAGLAWPHYTPDVSIIPLRAVRNSPHTHTRRGHFPVPHTLVEVYITLAESAVSPPQSERENKHLPNQLPISCNFIIGETTTECTTASLYSTSCTLCSSLKQRKEIALRFAAGNRDKFASFAVSRSRGHRRHQGHTRNSVQRWRILRTPSFGVPMVPNFWIFIIPTQKSI